MATGSAGGWWAKRSARWSFGGSSMPGRRRPGARFPGYADALGRALAELDGALLDADDLDEPLASFVRAYQRRARPARCVGSRDAPSPGHRAADRRPRVVGRQPGARARLRGPHRRRVAPPRGAFGAHRRPCVAAVRAGPRRLRVPRAHGRGSRGARRRRHRRPAAARRRVPADGAGARRARAVRADVGARAARRRNPLPRRSGNPWDARARGRGGAGRDPFRDRPGRDRGGLPVAGRDSRPARDGVRRARRARWRSRVGRRSARRPSGTR